MIAFSPKGTVPVLVLDEGSCGLRVIDESIDIMYWALGQNDPDGWLSVGAEMTNTWVRQNDDQFKPWLDRYKYPERGAPFPAGDARQHCEKFLAGLEQRLRLQPYVCSSQASIVDFALYPFVRQFAFVDRDWFLSSEYVAVNRWLQAWLESPLFSAVMDRYSPWQPGDAVTLF
jgi:glutathione S-transferase